MPSMINRVPQGLLSLLDMKSGGKNAQELSQTLISVLDATDFYLASKREFLSAQIAPALGWNSSSTLSPAPGEIWLVRTLCAFSNADIAAAATLQISVGLVPVGGAATIGGMGLGISSGVFSTGQRAMSVFPQSFFLQPGDQLGFYGQIVTGAPGNVRVNAQIARLTI